MNNFKTILFTGFFFTLFFLFAIWARCAEQAKYVGSEGCKECHANEYATFKQFNKKAHSFQSILRLRKGLSETELKKCFECHTTGYGKEGGFRSENETPHLKDAGCEVCHGPGGIHAETGDPKDIKGKLTTKDCECCHNAERVGAFKYKPLVYGGAH
ncbi:MAG TPA: cytochrome c family protein [Syntrophobacteraceae bacterium]|nr:cytochrome c family protein [Syntrophobacteraceae bacterium]